MTRPRRPRTRLQRPLRALTLLYALPALVFTTLALARAHLAEPDPTILLRDREGRFLGEVGADPEGFGYWRVDPLPWRVVAATLALEDRRFREHPGVDFQAVARAAHQNATSGEIVSGASTIAMQVARMQDPGARTLEKKAVEALTAVLITGRYGRDAVLAQYLRLAPYGNGIHGIAYASRRYLDKPVDDLSWAEIAFLSAIPQAPSRMDPFDPKGKARAIARGERILAVLHERGLLSETEYAASLVEIRQVHVPAKDVRPVDAMHAILHLEALLAADRQALGPQPLVYASLDLALQERALVHVVDAVRDWEGKGAGNAAVVVLDRETGEVLVSIGSTGYFDARHAGAIDYTRIPRNPGSTLKPLFYAAALDRGLITPGTVLDDLHRGPDGIANADDDFLGPLLPRQALANSRNVPAVAIVGGLGVDDSYALLRDLGLHDDRLPASHYGVGLAVGGLPVTLEDLAGAYLTLAGDGRVRQPSWLRDVPAPDGRRVLTEESTRQIALWLSDPMARLPSFPRMGTLEYPFPVAVKTGTSSDWRDAWTVAWSDEYLVAVWVGDPEWQPMAKLSGGAAAASLARSVLLDLHPERRDGLADLAFPAPEGHVAARVCPMTGHLAGEACDRVVTEWFAPASVPHEPCRAHVRVLVDTRDGLLATEATPDRFRDVVPFVDLGPRYAVWQERAGLPRPPTRPSTLLPHDPAPERVPVAALATPTDDTRVRVRFPRDGQHLVRDPDVPADQATLALHATVDPPVPQVVWYVDGAPFAVADYPYETRWPLAPGEHRIEARVPHTAIRSGAVRVTAQ